MQSNSGANDLSKPKLKNACCTYISCSEKTRAYLNDKQTKKKTRKKIDTVQRPPPIPSTAKVYDRGSALSFLRLSKIWHGSSIVAPGEHTLRVMPHFQLSFYHAKRRSAPASTKSVPIPFIKKTRKRNSPANWASQDDKRKNTLRHAVSETTTNTPTSSEARLKTNTAKLVGQET